MTPTTAQVEEWRESGCNAFILDSEVSLGTCGAQAYVYGYIRARTEQATEIAELKAKRTSLTDKQLRELHHLDEFGLFCSYEEFEQIARAIEQLLKEPHAQTKV